MGHVLTTIDNVTCGHTGKVTTSSTQKLKVGGNPVLVKDSVEGKAVVPGTCATKPPPSNNIPCTSVSSVTGGGAGKLQAGGQPVLLEETLAGVTNGQVGGVIQAMLKADTGQSKLTAV